MNGPAATARPRALAAFSLGAVTVLCLSPVLAQEAAETQGPAGESRQADALEDPQLSGSVSAGALVTSGNTESESANLEVDAELEYAAWRHALRVSGYHAAEEGQTTAEQYAFGLQSNYAFSERSYLFGSAVYARDRFGAFERRASLAAGLGRRFLDTARLRLDLEAGAGRRMQDPAGTDDSETEAIGRFRGDFRWSFSASGTFSQEVSVESGDSNTYTESISAVKSSLAGPFALRVAYTIQHNSDVPADAENTDTITSLSLQYEF